MFFSRYCPVAAATAAAWAAVTVASPTPMDLPLNQPQNDLVLREAMEATIHTPHLEKRLSADFSMDKEWKDEVLFSGSWINHDGDVATGVSLAVTCVDCYTKGTITASLTDDDIVDPSVRLSFAGVEAYVDLDVSVSSGATYAVNLFTTNSPIGLGFPGLSVGVVFYVDLVFSLTEEIDLEGGFYVKLADDAYLEASVFGGDITKHFFDGISSKSLPVTVKSGKATFKADLRLRVQAGAEADMDLFGIGAGAELGIYANLIEFVAVLDSTPTCALQSTEWWDLNVGAYAHLDVVVDWKTIGAIPTVSTTLLSAPTLTQCWIEGGGSGGGGSPSQPTITDASTPAYDSAGATATAITTTTPVDPASTETPYYPPLSTTTRYPLGNSSAPYYPTGSSAVYSTVTYAITSCAVNIVNCPASYQQEITVTKTVTAHVTGAPSDPPPYPTSTPAPVVHIITDVVVLVPCSEPIIETFAPPTSKKTPIIHQITATVVPVYPSSSPVGKPYGAGKEVKYSSGSSSSSSVSTYVPVPVPSATSKPSASASYPAAPSKSLVTAGATGRAGGSVVALLVVGAAALVLA